MDEQLQLSCMEIWGGNARAHSRVELNGINAWVYCVPFGQAVQGGDIHYMTSCATGRITRILVADVSGHGASVAEHALHLKRLMHRYTNYINQQKLVADLNRSFANYTSEGKFATAVAMTYFSPTGVLTYSNAGHPQPFLYKASMGCWQILEATSAGEQSASTDIPFGVLDDASYSQNDVQLEYNDIVLLYTDSLIDARGKDGKRLGVAGALSLLQGMLVQGHLPDADMLIDNINATLAASAEKSGLDDDMTLLLFSPSAIGQVKLARKLQAPWLMVKALLLSLQDKNQSLPWPEWSLRNIGGSLVDGLNKTRKKM